MKISRFIINSLAAAVVIAGIVVMSSCKESYEYSSTSGTPTVHFVRLAGNQAPDSVITAANPGTQVCIIGENLRSIHELYFNDRKAVLNTSFITDNALIVEIPSSLPLKNYKKIFMINCDNDTVAYDFEVYGIKPLIISMSAEYAAPGQEVIITGKYFINDVDDPLRVTIGDKDAKVISSTDETVTFIMPDVQGKQRVAVTSTYGTGYAKFAYRDDSGMLFNDWGTWDSPISTGLTNHGWHNMLIISEDTDWAVDGSYLQLGAEGVTMDAEGGWNDGAFSFEYWPGDWNTPAGFNGTDKHLSDLFDAQNWANLALKFEMCIPKSNPWQAGHMQVIFSGDEHVTLQTANNTFFHQETPILPRAIYAPWEATGSFDTNDQWITVTLPLETAFAYQYWGDPTPERLKPEWLTGLTIFVVDFANPSDVRTMKSGTDCQPIIKIDNVRVVEYK